MSRIARNIILAIIISGFSIIEPNCFNLLNYRVYASDDTPSLRSIYLSVGDNIAFKEDVHSYIVDVDKDTDEMFIKVKPDDPLDTVKINGQEVSKDDNYKANMTLDEGKNKVEIEVKDKNTEITSLYTVYVYRGGKDAVYLKDININGNTIGFCKGNNFYNIELDEGTDEVDLETIPDEGNYSITTKDEKLGATNSIKLKFNGIGKYTLIIGIKDEDTKRIGTYTLNIYLGIPVSPNISDSINKVLKPNQWTIVNGRWRYNDALGNCLKNTWFYDNKYKSYFHFNSRANMQTGWMKDGGTDYYLNSSGEMQTGWLFYENEWYYLDPNGARRTDWIEDNNKWYFLRKNGSIATGWIVCKDKWYHLNLSGVMQTGWIYYGGKWYYLNSDGVMETGWIKYKDEWYYLNFDGSMKSGEWFYDNGNWYYLNSYGNMRHDNITDIEFRGWFSDEDKYYFFNEDGAMRTSSITIDGYTYKFNEDGSVSNVL